jgi:alkylation response protein AidB-like acyl-CoA dehydrogenase
MAVHGSATALTRRGHPVADIYLDDCFVPDSARLPGVNSFKVALHALHFPPAGALFSRVSG